MTQVTSGKPSPGTAGSLQLRNLDTRLFFSLGLSYTGVVHGPAASASPGTLLEMQILRPHPELLKQNLGYSNKS